MRTPVLLLAALMVAACQSAEPTAEPAAEVRPSPSAAPAQAITSAERLIGEYRVAGADGKGIDLPYGIAASISADRIHITADCVNLEWSYRLAAGALTTGREPTRGCRRALTPDEQAIATAFDAATAVALTEANGYRFSGGGHSVTLFTQ
jgi:hypothetical protein